MAIISNPIDVDGNIKANLPLVQGQAGYATMMLEQHDGILGLSKRRKLLDASLDYRGRVGVDNILFQDIYNHTISNGSKYRITTTGMTVALVGGFLVLNNGSSVTTGQGALWQTYRTFRHLGSFPLYCEGWIQYFNSPQANSICCFGLFNCTSATTSPVDGAFFRLNGGGGLEGVINYNAGGDITTPLPTPIAGTNYHYLIVISPEVVQFWIDDVLYGEIEKPAAASMPYMSMSMPVSLLQRNNGAAGGVQQIKASSISVSIGDLAQSHGWAENQVLSGNGLYNAPDAAVSGLSANYVNSTVPADATLSNTAAGYATLGGQFSFIAVASAETDYELFAYLVPALGAGSPGRNAVITGVMIDTMNTGAAIATTATVLQWSLGVGQTSLNLSTADSLTSGVRQRRVIPLGLQSFAIGAAVGTVAQNKVIVTFQTPVICEPGTYIIVILKMPIATATASSKFRGIININGYFD